MARGIRPEPARRQAAERPRPEPAAPERRQLVFRRCQVCEWEGESVETSGADPGCPWCHAPTVRVGAALAADAPATPGGKNPFAAALGRLGGLKGGRARAARLSAKRRREIAQKAARARWKKK